MELGNIIPALQLGRIKVYFGCIVGDSRLELHELMPSMMFKLIKVYIDEVFVGLTAEIASGRGKRLGCCVGTI